MPAERAYAPPPPEPPSRTVLEAGVIRLRPLETGDRDAILEAVSESIAELATWMAWASRGYGVDDARVYLESRQAAWRSGDEYAFGIEDGDSGRFLGCVGLNQPNLMHRFMNLGYWVRTGAVGRGVATTAARRLAAWGFDRLGLHRVEIVIDPDNAASVRVAEKTGARREGLLRRRIAAPGRQRDALMFSLIPADLATDTKGT